MHSLSSPGLALAERLSATGRRLGELGLRFWARYRVVLAISGTVVCIGQLGPWMLNTGWPMHDSIAYWLAGRHLLEGSSVYGGHESYLAFRYMPPWAVILAPASALDPNVFTASLLILQVLSLRYIAGSWLVAGACGWLPFVPFELATGNVDLIMGAAILAAARNRPLSGYAIALFTLAKFAPILALWRAPRRLWIEFAIGAAILLAITLPWLNLWPEWWARTTATPATLRYWMPLPPRVLAAIGLLALRRPWATAAAAGLATPAFYFQSLVLLLPAARLWLEGRLGASQHVVMSDRDAPRPVTAEALVGPTSPETGVDPA